MEDAKISDDFRKDIRRVIDTTFVPLVVHNKKQEIIIGEGKALAQSEIRQRV